MSELISNALAARYAAPEWVFALEVRDATGFAGSRSADAIAMNCFPSRGLEIHGFEIKISRGDFLREMKDATKAEAVAQHCDRWWLVTPAGLVKPAELPAPWGLLELTEARGLVQKKPAALLQVGGPMARAFVASLLRGVQKRAERPLIAEADAAYRRGVAEERRVHDQNAKRASQSAGDAEGRARAALAAFEAASGVRVDEYSGPRIGEAVRAVLALRGRQDCGLVGEQAKRLHEIADQVEAVAAALSPLSPAQGA